MKPQGEWYAVKGLIAILLMHARNATELTQIETYIPQWLPLLLRARSLYESWPLPVRRYISAAAPNLVRIGNGLVESREFPVVVLGRVFALYRMKSEPEFFYPNALPRVDCSKVLHHGLCSLDHMLNVGSFMQVEDNLVRLYRPNGLGCTTPFSVTAVGTFQSRF